MKSRIARAALIALAILLVCAYFFLPYVQEMKMSSAGGREKEAISAGETLEWSWTPSMENVSRVSLTLSGVKKATGLTLQAEIMDASGTVVGSTTHMVAEAEEPETVTVVGSFSGSETYTIRLTAEGEGTVKVKGTSDDETEEFQPMIQEEGGKVVRNMVLLYFAAGLLLLALIPLKDSENRPVPSEVKEWDWSRLLPWLTFLMIAGIGLMVAIRKPAFPDDPAWQTWDEDVHQFEIQSLSFRMPGGFPAWLADVTTWLTGYLPLIVGQWIAELMTDDAAMIYMGSVIASTLVYAGMTALAVKHAPRYKMSFLVAATMPTIFFQMTSQTYDTVVIGSVLLGTALLMEALDGEQPLTAGRGIAMAAVFALGTLAKPAYSLAALTMLMIPAKKLGGKGRAWAFRGFVILMVVWCELALIVPGAYDNVIGGDARFAGADSAAQMAGIMANPTGEIGKLLTFWWEDQVFLTRAGIAHWAYLGGNGELNILYYVLLLLVAPVCAIGEKWDAKSPLSAGRRIGFVLAAFAAEFSLILAQYLVSSEVGGSVGGMQARYFIPLWILVAIGLMWPQAIRKRIGRAGDVMSVIVFAMCLGCNLTYALMWLHSTGY